ncbi:MAG: alpha/beta hydrolase [Actinomycetota bacterium]|nr:alpha/beta hydrolase [Actinomycetota bacterium]
MPVESIEGIRIAYEMKGEGKPIVFLHCWTGNRRLFNRQVERFSSDYQCILIDFPGHGESGECEEYSVERFGELTFTLLQKLGVRKAVFAGHSLGGMVCLFMAINHPGIVHALILLDTTPHLSGWFPQNIFAAAGVRLGKFGFRSGKALVAAAVATHPFSSLESKILTARECSKVKNKPLVETLDSLRRFDVRRKLSKIKKPALVVVGDLDMLADVRQAMKMAKEIPDAMLKIVRGAGHMALFEKPEIVNEAISDFLERVYPPVRIEAKSAS